MLSVSEVRSQTLIRPSQPPESKYLPSELQTRAVTGARWPVRCLIVFRRFISHKQTALSGAVNASFWPFGLKARASVQGAWAGISYQWFRDWGEATGAMSLDYSESLIIFPKFQKFVKLSNIWVSSAKGVLLNKDVNYLKNNVFSCLLYTSDAADE